MAITITGLTVGLNTPNPAVTASISPSNGNLVLAFATCVVPGSSGLTVSGESCSGAGITWNAVHPAGGWTTNFRRNTMAYWGVSDGTSGALTFSATPSEGSIIEWAWTVVEISGADNTTPFNTFYWGQASTTTSFSVDNLESPATDDFVYAYHLNEHTSPGSMTINAELSNSVNSVEGGSNIRSLFDAYDSTPDADPSPGWSWTNSATSFIVNVIVNVGAGASPQTLVPSAISSGEGFGSDKITKFPFSDDFTGSDTEPWNVGLWIVESS